MASVKLSHQKWNEKFDILVAHHSDKQWHKLKRSYLSNITTSISLLKKLKISMILQTYNDNLLSQHFNALNLLTFLANTMFKHALLLRSIFNIYKRNI